jgi:hypothetical protein
MAPTQRSAGTEQGATQLFPPQGDSTDVLIRVLATTVHYAEIRAKKTAA